MNRVKGGLMGIPDMFERPRLEDAGNGKIVCVEDRVYCLKECPRRHTEYCPNGGKK